MRLGSVYPERDVEELAGLTLLMRITPVETRAS
jgi:hypothetical protein